MGEHSLNTGSIPLPGGSLTYGQKSLQPTGLAVHARPQYVDEDRAASGREDYSDNTT
jgi:hypothetical protein